MELDKLRNGIDSIDGEILRLLNERMALVAKIGEWKRSNDNAIFNPEREQSILERLGSGGGRLSAGEIEAVFREIFAISRHKELPERVAYLGPEGSFTNLAAETRFGSTCEYVPLESIRAVFESVTAGRVRFGVVPVENNQEGSVSETVDMLGKGETQITAEFSLAIHFTLASRASELQDIDRVYSKDIAFLECRRFIRQYLKKEVSLIPVSSTSKAAELATKEPNSAAICSSKAARRLGVPELFTNIEDNPSNRTRFFIVSNDSSNPPTGSDKTSILAKLPDRPGALAELLREFEHGGVNLTKIDSRPIREGTRFRYWFLIELDGHRKDANISKILNTHSDTLLCLGSYVKGL